MALCGDEASEEVVVPYGCALSVPGGLWRSGGRDWRGAPEDTLLLHGSAAIGRVFREGLSGGDDGGFPGSTSIFLPFSNNSQFHAATLPGLGGPPSRLACARNVLRSIQFVKKKGVDGCRYLVHN
jgi:hypothetical protein